MPNDEEQEEAGQDQRQQLRQTFGTLNWQRSWSSTTVSQLALFGRFTNGSFAAALPTRRSSPRGIGSRTGWECWRRSPHEHGRHRFKGGVEASEIRLDESFGFFVTDEEAGEEAGLSAAALEHDSDDPFDFEGSVRRPIYSLYVQDSWRPLSALTLDLGVRYDRSRLLLNESQWSPRVGVSYRVDGPSCAPP